MTILNSLRFGLVVSLITLSYLCVGISGLLLLAGNTVANVESEPLGWIGLWKYYNEKIELVKISLL